MPSLADAFRFVQDPETPASKLRQACEILALPDGGEAQELRSRLVAHLGMLDTGAPVVCLNPAVPLASRPGRPEAAAAIWRWKGAAAPAASLKAAALRREGVIRALVGAVVGGVLFALGLHRLAYVAWGISTLILLAALVSPAGAYAAIGRGLQAFGRLVGRVLAVLLLTPVFFLFFLPFGRLLRGGRRDRLERWFDRAAPTYWRRRDDAPRTAGSYGKAF